MLFTLSWLAAALAAAAASTASAAKIYGDNFEKVESTPSRFDYRLTFKPPYFLKEKEIPYFEPSSVVVHGPEFLRLAVGVPMRKGAIWATKANHYNEWKAELTFTIAGRGSLGGEGLVLWYTKSPKPQSDDLDFYGHSSKFTGVAIVVDTSDVTNARYNPLIYGIYNDGTKSKRDFENYMSPSVSMGACFREVRNSPVPVHMRLSYLNKKLSLDVDIRQKGGGYTNCFTVDLPNLPSDYYFGITASTDEVGADDHDVHSLEVFEYNPKEKKEHKLRPHEKEEIAAGHKFKMDDELLKEIKQAEDHVRKVRESQPGAVSEDTPVGFNAQTVAQLEENQFRIIEALHLIEQKLDLPSTEAAKVLKGAVTISHQTEFETRLNTKFDNIRSEVDGIRNEVRQIVKSMMDLKQMSEKLLASIDNKVGQTRSLLDKAGAKTEETQQTHASALYNALYIFASLSGIGFVVFAYSMYLRAQKERQSKKFI